MKRTCLLLSFVCLCFCTFAIEIVSTTCNYTRSPHLINNLTPKLGWEMSSSRNGERQTAYQVVMASDPDALTGGKYDLWNSGKVKNDQSQQVAYQGLPLQYATRYFWRVRVWDVDGKASAWSEIHQFDTPVDQYGWNGSWIGAISREDSRLPNQRIYPTGNAAHNRLWNQVDTLAKRSIMLRKEFSIKKKIKTARLYICGLGHYELSINGKQVGKSKFAPLWSDYDKTVYYNLYDITKLLNTGENALGVLLGNGMYNVSGDRYTKFRVSFGPPTLLLQTVVDYTDGTRQVIASDRSWRYMPSPITFNCLFGGENYNACLEQPGWNSPGFDSQTWRPVTLQTGPAGVLTAQTAPPVIETEQYGVKSMSRPLENRLVFDMGQNISGYPRIKIKGEKGQKVRLIVSEVLEQGMADQSKSGAPHYYEYTLKGEGIEEWSPCFSYYGFQYIQVDSVDWKQQEPGNKRPILLDVVAQFIHSSASNTGSFNCSNERFNRTHFLIDKSTRSNMQAVFTDCPHREKLGWLEETHLNAPGLFTNYDLTLFLPKLQRDMADAQLANGLVPDIAPEYVIFDGGFRDSPEWGSASVINPWNYYVWYGDETLIREAYPSMKRYVDYLLSRSEDFIVSHGLGDWYDYGPHPAGPSRNTPLQITATGHFYYTADILRQAAALLGYDNDSQYYGVLCDSIKESFNRHLYNTETKQYGSKSQCSNALPLFLNLVPEQDRAAVLENLVTDIRSKGNRLSTGDVGNRYLYQALARNNRNDIMYDMHNHDEVPGYGFQIKMGVTTLTEQWDPRKGASWNHFMMGQIEEWFYQSLAGIKPDSAEPGFKHFIIEPVPAGDLSWVKGSYQSIYGKINSSWRIENDVFRLSLCIPVNTSAEVKLPSNKVHTLDIGKTNRKLKTNVRISENKTRFELLSGNYEISIDL